MKKLAVMASGSGTNAENLIRYFSDHPAIRVSLVLSNRHDAFVLERARKLGVPAVSFTREELCETKAIPDLLAGHGIDFIALAGFLWLVPREILAAYPRRVVNIHPALLPRYGGKGMYGEKVHRSVIEAGDSESGITIHYVNEQYDEGDVVFQAKCPVLNDDTPETLAQRIHSLEYEHYPKVIERLIMD